MYAITKIEYKNSIARIELDSGEKISLPYEIASQYRLESGKNLEREEYLQIMEESVRFLCGQKALSCLALRPRSEEEMRRYLRKKNFPETAVRETIEGLRQSGRLNDLEFSAGYIRSRRGRKAVGKNLLMRELQGKGIERRLIQKALKDSGVDSEDRDEIYKIARKKYESVLRKPNRLKKVAFFLRQRGFSSEGTRDALERLLREGFRD